MTRLHVALFVLLLVAVAVVGSDAPGQPSFAANPAEDCGTPRWSEAMAVFHAADRYMSSHYPSVYGGAQVRRLVGDWALVVVLPKVPADRAALILRWAPGQGWRIVGGPGTAFPPEARPAGMPPEVLEATVDCGNA